MDLLAFIMGLEPLIRSYSAIFAFVTSLFLGEEIILILSFLSANGYLPLWEVFVFCFAGRVISDFFFFALGKFKIANLLRKYQDRRIYINVEKVFSKLNRKNLFATLLYTKFLIGMRIAIMFYIGAKGDSLKKTFISDLAAVFVWLLVLIPIGWFAGSSFKLVLEVFNDLRIAILFLFILIILGFVIKNYIQKKILERRTQLLS